MTYPIALRVRAIRMYLEFVKSFRRLGTLLDVGKSTIQRWVTPPWIQKSMSRKTVLKITDRARKLIHDTVQQSPFATANQLVQTLREQLDLNVSGRVCSCSLQSHTGAAQRTWQYRFRIRFGIVDASWFRQICRGESKALHCCAIDKLRPVYFPLKTSLS